MADWTGLDYTPTDADERVVEIVMAEGKGKDTGRIYSSLVEVWSLTNNGAPGPAQHDWFQFMAPKIFQYLSHQQP